MRRLVVTGDDFGRSPGVNRAIVEAHERGILTSASLMVGGVAAAEAVELARSHPTLAVGLHVVVVDGRSVLSPSEVPALVDGERRFRGSAVTAGLRYQLSGSARRQLRREIRAQLERFRATGLPLSHVDGHHHMHLHPFVLGVLVELSSEFGIRWIRLPSEELSTALGADPQRAAAKLFWSAVFRALRMAAALRMRAAEIGFADRVYGLLSTGRIREDYLLRLIPRLTGDLVELYCHPEVTGADAAARGAAVSGEEELAALVSARVRDAVARSGLDLTSFLALGASSRSRTAYAGDPLKG